MWDLNDWGRHEVSIIVLSAVLQEEFSVQQTAVSPLERDPILKVKQRTAMEILGSIKIRNIQKKWSLEISPSTVYCRCQIESMTSKKNDEKRKNFFLRKHVRIFYPSNARINLKRKGS